MAINPALLIAAPMLQDSFVDNATDAAMSAGVITCYQDNSRTTLKNWYYQSGTPGNYTYIPLPNPLTLSAAGTIEDAMGNDTIPFFYPYSETDNQTPQPYYITCVNSNGQAQFTRQNFPFIPQQPIDTTVPTLDNVLINNVFWRNVNSVNVSMQTEAVIAPGAHDGMTNPDIRFIKNITGATDNITFTPFGLGNDPLSGDITPEVYLNFSCSASTPGETQKCIQIPINAHIKTLESVPATITIQAQNVAGNTNNTLSLFIYQYLGTGAISQPPPVLIRTITLTNSWQKYVIPFIFPSAAGAVLGSGGDDALFLQVGYPLSNTCNINFTLPSIYLSNDVPSNSFTDYDQINSIISAPRTGDIRTTLNNFALIDWILMDDTSIGSLTSGAFHANIATWPLYNLLWNSVGVTWAPMVDGMPYGANAITDWSNNRAIFLTKMLGRALAGQNSGGGLVPGSFNGAATETLNQTNIPTLLNVDISSTADLYQVGASGINGVGGSNTTPVGISNPGGGQPFSIVQPTSYFNVFIKL